MKWSLSVCLLAAAASGQTPSAPPAPPAVQGTPAAPAAAPAPITAETVIASVKGKPVTKGEIDAFIQGFPPQVRQSFASNPKEIVRQYLIFRYIADMAAQAHLDQQSPVKEQLAFARTQILWQAQIGKVSSEQNVIPEDFQKYYDSHKDKYTQAKVRAIYIPFSNTPAPASSDPKAKKPMTEAEAKARAEEVVKAARSGTDFAELVKKYSEDPNSASKGGELPPISLSEALPEPLKGAIFSLKKDQISEPVKHTNGYYVFKGEGVTTQKLDEVRNSINEELKQDRMRNWMQKTEQEADVKIENEGYFSSLPKPPAQ